MEKHGENDRILNDRIENVQTLFERFAQIAELPGFPEAQQSAPAGLAKDFNKVVEREKDEGRKLRIGIVGQVKAGKSSFLNAMLFGGKSILPKAATPMTAALTFLKHGPRIRAEVEFFSREDWKTVKELADQHDKLVEEAEIKERQRQEKEQSKGGLLGKLVGKAMQGGHQQATTVQSRHLHVDIPEEWRAAKELYEKSRRIANFESLLGKTEVIEDLTDIEALKGRLGDYVGAEGRLTPLTKSLAIDLPYDELRDVEVVDTPGINDPVVSRGDRTRQFLGECHAVFLLSYAGQFMGKQDAGFLTESLPNKGIRKIVLCGSKFDSALLDEGDKYNGQLKMAIKDLRNKLGEQAQRTLHAIINESPGNPLFQSLEKCLPPVFISGMAYQLAVKHPHNWDEEERHIHKQLQGLFPDFPLEGDNLLDLSNIPAIKEKNFQEIRKERDTILEETLGNKIVGYQSQLKKIIQEATENIKASLSDLYSRDIREVRVEQAKFSEAIDDAEERVFDNFDEFINSANKSIRGLSMHARRAAEGRQVDAETKSSEESYTERVEKSGAGSWIARKLWGGGYEEKTRYRTVTTTCAKVYDAIESIDSVVDEVVEKFNTTWDDLLRKEDLEKMRKKLAGIIPENLLEDPSFDARKMRKILRDASESVDPPQLDIDSRKYAKRIRDRFSGSTVTNSDVDQLQELHRELLKECVRDISKTIDDVWDKTLNALKKKRDDFTGEIKGMVNQRVKEFEKDIQDKEGAISRKKVALDKLSILLADVQKSA
jgi:hypothetical protein